MRRDSLRFAADLLTVVVVASVGVALAGLTWRLAGSSGLPLADGPLETARPAAAPVDISRIMAAAPFGAGAAAPQAVASDLQLKAILFAHPSAASSVMVSANGGPAQSYLIGAILPNGAVLESVAFDQAVIRTGAGQQVLAFPRALPSGGAAGNATGAGDAAAVRALIPAAAQGAPPPSPAPAPNQRAASIAPGPGPASVLDSLGATPAGSGYRIGAAPAPQFQAAGLRSGDVIERVNGNAVGNPQNARSLFDAAMAAGSAQIELVRDGKRITLSIPLR